MERALQVVNVPLLQRETLEFIPIAVTVNGEAVTQNVEFCIVGLDERPTAFAAAVTLDGSIGVMIDASALGVGLFRIFAKITDSPEVPVIDAGTFRIV